MPFSSYYYYYYLLIDLYIFFCHYQDLSEIGIEIDLMHMQPPNRAFDASLFYQVRGLKFNFVFPLSVQRDSQVDRSEVLTSGAWVRIPPLPPCNTLSKTLFIQLEHPACVFWMYRHALAYLNIHTQNIITIARC